MSEILFNDLASQWRDIEDECLPTVTSVLRSGNYVSGRSVEKFEAAFAKYTGTNYSVALNSGTSALYAALFSLGIGAGDKVIVQNNTFIATVSSVLMVGATPVLIDVNYETGQVEVGEVERIFQTERIAAVIVVHLWGHASEIQNLSILCKEYEVKLVEDCAQAHGTRVNGTHVGSFGDIGCFSFYPGKGLGAAGEGGAIVTNDSKLADSVQLIRNWGQKERYVHSSFGINLRMDEIQAVVLSAKLERLNAWNASKHALVSRYRERLPIEWLFESERMGESRGYHLFVVKVPNRESVITKFNSMNIPFGIHYPITLSNQHFLKNKFISKAELNNSKELAKKIISLPLHPWLKISEIDYISDLLIDS
jgi:dTDP-4-amino-4,6-dideoxygalactose transaminase